MRRLTLLAALISCVTACSQVGAPEGAGGEPPAQERTVELEPVRDNTLIESPAGDLSNGSGPSLFAGRTHQRSASVRRALVAFDLAGAVPAGAKILDARLTLSVDLGPENEVSFALHRALADWGEGESFFRGGRGAPAAEGDATWIHTFFDTRRWARPGGEHTDRPSAARTVAGPGPYTWGPTPEMRDDVQLWLDRPKRNFGWMVVGDETQPGTVKSFSSREAGDPASRPRLSVTFR